MGDFQIVTDFGNLYKSYKKSMRGKGKKKGAIKFDAMALENICVMRRQLIEHTYQISPYAEFVVTEPKPRNIKSGSFRDKVLPYGCCGGCD